MLTTFTQNLRAEFEALKAKIEAGAEADLSALESHIVSIEEVLGLRGPAPEAPAEAAQPSAQAAPALAEPAAPSVPTPPVQS